MNTPDTLNLKSFYSFLSSLIKEKTYGKNDIPQEYFEHEVTCWAMLKESKIQLTLNDIAPHIRDNPLFMVDYFSIQERDPAEYESIPEGLLNNPYFITQILKHNPDIFLLTQEEHRQNPIFLESLERYHFTQYMKYMPAHIQANRSACSVALKHHSANFQWFSEELKLDSYFLHEAISMRFENAQYLPKEFLNNEDNAQHIVSSNGLSLLYLPLHFKNNETIVKKAIFENAKAFKFASARLREDDTMINYAMNCEKKQKYSIVEVLSSVPYQKFDNPAFIEKYKVTIAEQFSSFSPKYRQHLNILWAAFSSPEESNFLHMDLVKSGKLKNQLKIIAKQKEGTRHQLADLMIRRFSLHENLNTQLLDNQIDDIIEPSTPKI
jgi:hypothetical protein